MASPYKGEGTREKGPRMAVPHRYSVDECVNIYNFRFPLPSVIPAKAGIQCLCYFEPTKKQRHWILYIAWIPDQVGDKRRG